MSGILVKVRLSSKDRKIVEWIQLQSTYGQAYSKVIELALTYHSLTNEYPNLGNIRESGDEIPATTKNIYFSEKSRALEWLERRQEYGENKTAAIKRVLNRCITGKDDSPSSTIYIDELTDMLISITDPKPAFTATSQYKTQEEPISPAAAIHNEVRTADEKEERKISSKDDRKEPEKQVKLNPITETFLAQGFGFDDE